MGVGGPDRRGPLNALTNISNVERGRWKLVNRTSTARKAWPGVEDRRLAFEGADDSASVGGGLEQPKRGGPDRDDASAPSARRIQGLSGRGVETTHSECIR